MAGREMDLSGTKQEQVTGFCKHGIETASPINCGRLIE